MKISFIAIVAFFTIYLPIAHALPPDPELQSAIQTARKFTNLKPRYTQSEITECATDSFVTLAKNWHNLPAMYRQEFKPIFFTSRTPRQLLRRNRVARKIYHTTF